MKAIASLLLFAFLLLPARAEVFIGPTTPANRFVIKENEAILIQVLALDQRSGLRDSDPSLNPGEFRARVFLGDQSFSAVFNADYDVPPVALAGPLELQLTNKVVFSYRPIQTTAFRTVLVGTNSTAKIEVPAGKTFRSFDLSFNAASLSFEVSKQNDSAVVGIYDLTEFAGPLTIRPFVEPGSFERGNALLTYYFLEDSIVLPELGAVQGPTGTFEIVVEKSINLTNWLPVVTHFTSSDQKAFYRLKLSR